MSVGDPITKQCFTDVARQSLRGLPAGTMRVLGFVLAERAERVLGFVLAERAERVLGFVERQNRCKAILCSELQSISAILSFCRVMFQVLVLSCMDERAERAERVCRKSMRQRQVWMLQ